MTQRIQTKQITETAVENIKETSHWVFAIAPIIASILATLFGKDAHKLELGFIFLAILVNFLILWLRSKTEEEKELSLFYTFWTNNLLPNRTGYEQRYNVQVAIIEDEESSYFRDNLQSRFKKELSLEKLKSLLSKEPKLKRLILKEPKPENLVLEEVQDRHLFFLPINIASPTKEEEEEIKANFKTSLETDLKHATAVVVVRTSKLEEKSWVYKAIDSWAYEHSDVPILFARNPNENFPKNETANRFLRIPDDPKSLPWRLLQRAKGRALAWRTQASFNRAMVTNIFFLSLMFIYVGAIWIKTQKEEHHTAIIGMHAAIETKELYEKQVIGNIDGNLKVSYWFRHDGKPYVFVTTENWDTKNYFENDKTSIIGCGFVEPSKVVQWQKGDETRVFDSDDTEKPNHGCVMDPRVEPITSIVCSAYQPSETSSQEATVGICVFTGSGNSILVNDYRRILKERTVQFYKDFRTLIENKQVTPLAERIK